MRKPILFTMLVVTMLTLPWLTIPAISAECATPWPLQRSLWLLQRRIIRWWVLLGGGHPRRDS